jgi:hypothetical protein
LADPAARGSIRRKTIVRRSPLTSLSDRAGHRGGQATPEKRRLGIEDLRAAILNGRVRVTDKAEEGARTDRLTLEQVFSSLFSGEVLEKYPADRPFASWLVLGRTADGRPIHSVWACNSKNGWAVLIRCTVASPQEPGNNA